MKIKVFTLFPEMLRPMLEGSILGRAIRAGLLSVELIDIRDYTQDKHRRTDDYPFGGGAGMVMSAQPIVDAMTANTDADFHGRRIYLSPRGRTLNQSIVEELAQAGDMMLLCGHYEGVDQRALDAMIDEELSIGDYVLTGGELGALVVIDAVSRMIPGVLGSAESGEDESFTTGLLEYPQYTRPAEFRGVSAPQVLLDGNHADIVAWRREQQLDLTRRRRPDMLPSAPLTDDDRETLRKLELADEAAEKLGIPVERMELRLSAQIAKEWVRTFVPEINRSAAKKMCISGRRHIGYLWQAFTMGFAEGLQGEAALEAWAKVEGGCTVALTDEGIAFTAKDAQAVPIEPIGGTLVLISEDNKKTLVVPKSGAAGAWYTEIE